MSLLLEALKKAEKAKEEAQRQARAEIDAPQGADAETAPAAPRHVVTRAELPDISQPLEILSEDLQAEPPSRARPLGPEPESVPAAAGAERGEHLRDDAAGPRVRERRPAGARMAEPYREPDPRAPFHAALGVLAVIAAVTAGYFWYQLRPAPGLVSATPPRAATDRPADAASINARRAAAPVEAPSASGALAVPGLPPLKAKEPAAALEPVRGAGAPTPSSPSATERPASAAPAAAPKPTAPSARAAAARAAPQEAAAARQTEPPRALSAASAAPRIHPQVLAAYGAYQTGDLAAARTGYEQALREEPANRDALLGLAAVEMRAQRFEQSAAYYERLLQVDPRDPHAHAGMLALRGQYVDPVRAESRLKNMLAADPGAEVLYFTLGNQYAQQERWADAQQAYFKAYAADSENPDFAFNLAVSLDHLRQTGLALEYYRRALALAQKRAANFAAETARQREAQLAR